MRRDTARLRRRAPGNLVASVIAIEGQVHHSPPKLVVAHAERRRCDVRRNDLPAPRISPVHRHRIGRERDVGVGSNSELGGASEALQSCFDKAFIKLLVGRLVATNEQVAEWDLVAAPPDRS